MHNLGCWKDSLVRAIAGGHAEILTSPETAVQVCRMRAEAMGWNIFGVLNGQQCYTSADAGDTYQKYGAGTGCTNGGGGFWRMDVYEIRCSGLHKLMEVYLHEFRI